MSRQIIKLTVGIAISVVLLRSILPVAALVQLKPTTSAVAAVDVIVPNPSNDQISESGTLAPSLSRQQIERMILAATVRFEMRTWIVHVEGKGYMTVHTDGHGTIKDGRYLVTHNHLDETAKAILFAGDPDQLMTITIFGPDGEEMIAVPAQRVSVAGVDSETLVLDFGLQDGKGFFEGQGLASAQFLAGQALSLEAGTEVAQIDWDGNTTRVDWVRIETFKTYSGTPIVRLSDSIKQGASGGGVFWQGNHIGNNWSTSPASGANSDATPYSHVALNAAQVLTTD